MYHLVLASFFIVIYQSSLVYIGLHTADCIEFINHGNRNVTYVSKNDSVNNVDTALYSAVFEFRLLRTLSQYTSHADMISVREAEIWCQTLKRIQLESVIRPLSGLCSRPRRGLSASDTRHVDLPYKLA